MVEGCAVLVWEVVVIVNYLRLIICTVKLRGNDEYICISLERMEISVSPL